MDDNEWSILDDEQKQEIDEDKLLIDLADELIEGDPEDALSRAEDLGYSIDDLPL